MKLHYRQYGQGPAILILHGLFGSGDNWLTQAKLLSDEYQVYTLDQRNHGLSPHDPAFDYKVMADDLHQFILDHHLQKPIVLGHSMGGKTAMNFALAYPNSLSKLIVVDIAPRAYNLEHYIIANGLAAIPINTIKSRNEADLTLAEFVPEPDVRQFLLKNLQRTSDGFTWKINLPVIRENLANVGAELLYPGTVSVPTLFIRGSRSNYIQEKDVPLLHERFSNSSLITLDTGHWVQAEMPEKFVAEVKHWLAS